MCAICGLKNFKNVTEYHAHYRTMHSVRALSETTLIPPTVSHYLKPVNTSGRSKEQIVHDMEKVWGHAVFPQVKPWHSVGEIVSK